MEQLAPALSPTRSTTTSTAAPPTRVAVVGCGYWGKNLVRVFHGLGALKTVCESHAVGAQQARKIAPGVAVEAEFQAVLDDPKVEGVVLATPAETHYRLGLQALEAGKHLFVEKPLALHYREGLAMVRKAAAKGLQLMVG